MDYYYSTLKKNEILIHAIFYIFIYIYLSLSMKLENIMPNEICHTQKDKYCMSPYMKYLE